MRACLGQADFATGKSDWGIVSAVLEWSERRRQLYLIAMSPCCRGPVSHNIMLATLVGDELQLAAAMAAIRTILVAWQRIGEHARDVS
jgi:hypothetical protein